MMRNIKNYVRGDSFKITIKNNYIDIEDYTDIKNITEKEITIYNKNDKIKIIGNNLVIKKLLNNEVLILGNLVNIKFEGLNE